MVSTWNGGTNIGTWSHMIIRMTIERWDLNILLKKLATVDVLIVLIVENLIVIFKHVLTLPPINGVGRPPNFEAHFKYDLT